MGDKPLPLFAVAVEEEQGAEEETVLPRMSLGQHVSEDYASLHLSLKQHPLALLRSHLPPVCALPAARLRTERNGTRVGVAGLVLVRQRPGTASGVIFATLEDETGVANLVIWPKVFERYRRIVMTARLMGVTGRVQSESNVTHVVAERLMDLSHLLTDLAEGATPGAGPARPRRRGPPPGQRPAAGGLSVAGFSLNWRVTQKPCLKGNNHVSDPQLQGHRLSLALRPYGHMNVMWYVGKFDEATWHLFARIGLTPSALRESRHGMAAVQQNIAYKRELLAGDIVEVESRILEMREKVIRFQHEMRNAETGEIAAVCELTGVHMDRQLRKSCAFPDAIRAAAQKLLPEASS